MPTATCTLNHTTTVPSDYEDSVYMIKKTSRSQQPEARNEYIKIITTLQRILGQ